MIGVVIVFIIIMYLLVLIDITCCSDLRNITLLC